MRHWKYLRREGKLNNLDRQDKPHGLWKEPSGLSDDFWGLGHYVHGKLYGLWKDKYGGTEIYFIT